MPRRPAVTSTFTATIMITPGTSLARPWKYPAMVYLCRDLICVGELLRV